METEEYKVGLKKDLELKILIPKKRQAGLSLGAITIMADAAIDTLKNPILKHKWLPLEDDIEVQIEYDPIHKIWILYVVTGLIAGGRGRRSKEFMEKQKEDLARAVPEIRQKVIDELSKLIIRKEAKDGKENSGKTR